MLFAELAHVPDPPAPDTVIGHRESDKNVVEKAYDASDHERQLVNEEPKNIEAPPHTHENDVPIEVESASTTALDDAPKKSYASIVSVQAQKLFNKKILCLFMYYSLVCHCR